MSSRCVLTPAPARCAAMALPMTPAPITAAVRMDSVIVGRSCSPPLLASSADFSVRCSHQAANATLGFADGVDVRRVVWHAAVTAHTVTALRPVVRIVDRHHAPFAEVAAAVAAVFADQPAVSVNQTAA